MQAHRNMRQNLNPDSRLGRGRQCMIYMNIHNMRMYEDADEYGTSSQPEIRRPQGAGCLSTVQPL